MRINGKKFEIALARKCWREKDLAMAMGISTTALYYQLHRTKDLRPQSVGKMARALEVPVEEIGM